MGRPENPAPVFPFGSGPALGGAFGELAGQQEGTGQQHNASAFGATQATSSLGRAPDQTDAMSAEMKPPAALTGRFSGRENGQDGICTNPKLSVSN